MIGILTGEVRPDVGTPGDHRMGVSSMCDGVMAESRLDGTTMDDTSMGDTLLGNSPKDHRSVQECNKIGKTDIYQQKNY